MFRKLHSHVGRHVVGYVALFVALGPPAYATHHAVNSASIIDGQVLKRDLGKNAVRTGKIADGQVFPSDLSGNAKTRKIDYGVVAEAPFPKRVLLRLGSLELSAVCFSSWKGTFAEVFAKNIGGQRAQLNVSFLAADGADGIDVTPRMDGAVLDPGQQRRFLLQGGGKSDGQLILRAPGGVTTVTFHIGTNQDARACEMHGNGVLGTS